MILDALFADKMNGIYRQIIAENGFLKICQEEQIGMIINKCLLGKLQSNDFSWLKIVNEYSQIKINVEDITNTISNVDVAISIIKYFENIFLQFDYTLQNLTNYEIIFGNQKSQMKFVFENRYVMMFEAIYIVNLETNEAFQLSELFDFLFPDIAFNARVKAIMGDFGNLKKTYFEAYSYIIEEKLVDLLYENNFSWSDEYKKYLKAKYPW
jgi:hypothetical protein